MLRELVKDNTPAPEPSDLETVKAKTAQYLEHIGSQVSGEIIYPLILAPSLDMAPVRLAISLTRAALDEIDVKAEAQSLTRSGFLAHAALKWRAA